MGLWTWQNVNFSMKFIGVKAWFSEYMDSKQCNNLCSYNFEHIICSASCFLKLVLGSLPVLHHSSLLIQKLHFACSEDSYFSLGKCLSYVFALYLRKLLLWRIFSFRMVRGQEWTLSVLWILVLCTIPDVCCFALNTNKRLQLEEPISHWFF